MSSPADKLFEVRSPVIALQKLPDDRFITTNGRLVTKRLFRRAHADIKRNPKFSSSVKAVTSTPCVLAFPLFTQEYENDDLFS
jgi:hypothetical protein